MVKLHIKLDGEESLDYKTNGIINNNKIVYKENDITVNVLKLKNEVRINRKSKDYEIDLYFKKNSKTISNYSIFGGKKKFELETITKNLIITDTKIIIEYALEGNKFKYILEEV